MSSGGRAKLDLDEMFKQLDVRYASLDDFGSVETKIEGFKDLLDKKIQDFARDIDI